MNRHCSLNRHIAFVRLGEWGDSRPENHAVRVWVPRQNSMSELEFRRAVRNIATLQAPARDMIDV